MVNTSRAFLGLLTFTIICILGYITSTGLVITWKDAHVLFDVRPALSSESGQNTSWIQDIHSKRVEKIKRKCKNIKRKPTMRTPSYYFASRFNFTFCKVPKSGSTFLTQMFAILNNSSIGIDALLYKKRRTVHQTLGKLSKIQFKSDILQQAPAVIVSRDPYSRLYSAFIDKYFLFGYGVHSGTHNYRQKRRKCELDTSISFQKFLNSVTRDGLNNKKLNAHWSPIYNSCRPCDVHTHVLVQLETFTADVAYVLETFGVDDKEKKTIMNALHENRVRSSVIGIVKTKLSNEEKHKTFYKCLGALENVNRLWTSFQIQGYIRNNLSFPYTSTNSPVAEIDDVDFITDLILKVIEDDPLSKEERDRQRRQALVNAYQQIDSQTIRSLQKIYKADFEMLGYSKEPPVTI